LRGGASVRPQALPFATAPRATRAPSLAPPCSAPPFAPSGPQHGQERWRGHRQDGGGARAGPHPHGWVAMEGGAGGGGLMAVYREGPASGSIFARPGHASRSCAMSPCRIHTPLPPFSPASKNAPPSHHSTRQARIGARTAPKWRASASRTQSVARRRRRLWPLRGPRRLPQPPPLLPLAAAAGQLSRRRQWRHRRHRPQALPRRDEGRTSRCRGS
jgi:hypothetical protein